MSNRPRWWLQMATDPRTCTVGRCGWQPPVDVYRTVSGWLVKFDLAGVQPTDLRIDCEGSYVRVVGQRRDLAARRTLASYSLEINYNRFERSVRLPGDIECGSMRTEFENGMLLIWLETASDSEQRGRQS